MSPERPIRSRRVARCGACWLPHALCVCAELPCLAVRTRVVVMMHKREAITSTNTGRLAARLLEGASVRVRGLRDAGAPEPLPEGRRLALFPAPGARVLTAEDAAHGPVTLLVPDGTWPQARRLVRRDAELAGAEIVAVPLAAPSRYTLRRSPRADTLCTLEAIARAIGVLEGAEIEERLLAALDRFVARAREVREGRVHISAAT